MKLDAKQSAFNLPGTESGAVVVSGDEYAVLCAKNRVGKITIHSVIIRGNGKYEVNYTENHAN